MYSQKENSSPLNSTRKAGFRVNTLIQNFLLQTQVDFILSVMILENDIQLFTLNVMNILFRS